MIIFNSRQYKTKLFLWEVLEKDIRLIFKQKEVDNVELNKDKSIVVSWFKARPETAENCNTLSLKCIFFYQELNTKLWSFIHYANISSIFLASE